MPHTVRADQTNTATRT